MAVSPVARFRAVAFLDELLSTPELLVDYAQAFAGREDAELVVHAPQFAGAEADLERELQPLICSLELDRDGAAEIVVVTDPAEAPLAQAAAALYTRAGRNGAFAHLPDVDSATELLQLASAQTAPRSVSVAERPIFIVGAPRSGTSMLSHLLRRHPELWGGEESDFLGPLVRDTLEAHAFGTARGDRHWLAENEVSESELLSSVGIGINALYTSRSGGLRWVEQTPEYTLWMDRLGEMFPDALFVLVLRDGREVTHSLMNFEQNRKSLTEGAELWKRFVEAGVAYARVHGDRVLTIDFHRLVDEPEAQVRELLDFVGVPFHEPCLEVIRDPARVNSSFIYKPGERVGSRWSAWSREQRAEFDAIAGEVLIDLGFAADRSWVEAAPAPGDSTTHAVRASWRGSATLGGADPSLPERAYPGMQYADVMSEHAQRYSWAAGLVAGLDVLDLGCGTGYGSEILTWTAARVRGFDLWRPSAAEEPAWPGGAELSFGHDLCRGDLPQADAAVLFEVVEHLDDAPAALRRAWQAASLLVLSFPNPVYHGSHHNPHHVNDWTLAELEQQLRAAAGGPIELQHLHQQQGLILPGRDERASYWLVVARRSEISEAPAPAIAIAQGGDLRADEMKREWDKRAAANAMHFIASGKDDWDEAEFSESGRINVDQYVGEDLALICGGRDPKALRALEIGCGIGRMTEHLASIFGEVHGIDVSGEMIRRGTPRLAHVPNAHLLETNGAELPFPDEFFDFVFSFIVFQHVPSKEAVIGNLRDAFRVLTPGGLFKFQVQGSQSPHYVTAPKDTWHGVTFSEQEMRALAAEIGFEPVGSDGVGTQYFWHWWRKHA